MFFMNTVEPAPMKAIFGKLMALAPSGPSLEDPSDQGQRTSGGIEERIESTFPPVFRPKIVPRSYNRLNST